MAFRPLLRPGLRLVPWPDGGVRVTDLAGGVSLDVPPDVAPLLAALDGRLEVEQVLAVSGVPADAGALALRSLAMTACLLGVDEAGRQGRVEARAAGADQEAPFRLATGTRFACGACGACCRTPTALFDAPLSRDEMARLARADFVRGDPALRDAALFVARAHDGDPPGTRFALGRRADGACVFLDAAARCRVHLELGADAKPLACRLFPLRVLPTAGDAIVVADGLECGTFSTSSVAGAPLYERWDELRPVLREAARRAPVVSGAVLLSCDVVVPATHARLGVWRAVEALDATPGTWLDGAAAALGALACYEALARTEPLGPGLPERVIERLWAIKLEALAAGPDGMPPPDAVGAALARTLERVRAAVSDEPTRRAIVAATEGVQVDGALDAALRRALRQRLHGLALEAEGALAPPLAGALVATLVTAAAATLEAGIDAAQPGVARALGTEAVRAALREGAADARTLTLGGVTLPATLGSRRSALA